MPAKKQKKQQNASESEDEGTVEVFQNRPERRVSEMTEEQARELMRTLWVQCAEQQQQQPRQYRVADIAVKFLDSLWPLVAGISVAMLWSFGSTVAAHWVEQSKLDGDLRRELARANPELMFQSSWNAAQMASYAITAYTLVATMLNVAQIGLSTTAMINKARQVFGTPKLANKDKDGEKESKENKEKKENKDKDGEMH